MFVDLFQWTQEVRTTTRQNLQLVGVTSLFVAAKYEEMYPPEIAEFVYITDDTYTKKQILDMEQHILKKLGFQMGRPLPLHFLRRFAKAAHHRKSNNSQYAMAKYFIELAAVDYSMVHHAPSKVSVTGTWKLENVFGANRKLNLSRRTQRWPLRRCSCRCVCVRAKIRSTKLKCGTRRSSSTRHTRRNSYSRSSGNWPSSSKKRAAARNCELCTTNTNRRNSARSPSIRSWSPRKRWTTSLRSNAEWRPILTRTMLCTLVWRDWNLSILASFVL